LDDSWPPSAAAVRTAFGGDLGQRIFQQPFSWKELGVDIRGRSTRLRINYRTSHQIRNQADRLLDPELSDVDGVTEDRRGTIEDVEVPERHRVEAARVHRDALAHAVPSDGAAFRCRKLMVVRP